MILGRLSSHGQRHTANDALACKIKFGHACVFKEMSILIDASAVANNTDSINQLGIDSI